MEGTITGPRFESWWGFRSGRMCYRGSTTLWTDPVTPLQKLCRDGTDHRRFTGELID